MNQLDGEVSVRFAKCEDFSGIVKIMQKLASSKNRNDSFSITPEQLIKDGGFKSIDDPKLFECVVAEMKFGTKFELIGYVTFYYGMSSWEGKIAYLADLDFDEQFRTNEIIKMLISFVSKEILKNGAAWLRFEVRDKKDRELFEAIGAKNVTIEYDYHVWTLDYQSLKRMSSIEL